MASLDYTNGTVIEAGKLKPIAPQKDRLVPVSKVSRFDTPLVEANESFIAYSTARPGVIRVISQEDASHVALNTGGKHVHDLSLTTVGQFTWIAAVVEHEGDLMQLWTWRLPSDKCAGDMTEQETTGRQLSPFKPLDSNVKIKFMEGTTKLLISGDGMATPFVNEYDVSTSSQISHQAVFSNVIDVSLFGTEGKKLIMSGDGALYTWKYEGAGPYLHRVNVPVIKAPQGLLNGGGAGIVAFDNKIAILNSSMDGFKCVIDLGGVLAKQQSATSFKLLEFESKYVIVADIFGNSLVFVRLSANMSNPLFRSISVMKLPEQLDLQTIAVTKNVDNQSGMAFDIYLYHSKGLAILQVEKTELMGDGATVWSAKSLASPSKKAQQSQSRKGKGKKRANASNAGTPPSGASASAGGGGLSSLPVDVDKIVSLVAHKLIKSGQFVTRKEYDTVKQELDQTIARLESLQMVNDSSQQQTQQQPIWPPRPSSASIWAPIGSPSSSLREEVTTTDNVLDTSWGSIKQQQPNDEIWGSATAEVAESVLQKAIGDGEQSKNSPSLVESSSVVDGTEEDEDEVEENEDEDEEDEEVIEYDDGVEEEQEEEEEEEEEIADEDEDEEEDSEPAATKSDPNFIAILTSMIQDTSVDNIKKLFPQIDRNFEPQQVELADDAILSTAVILAHVFQDGPIRQPTHAKILDWINQMLRRCDDSFATQQSSVLERLSQDLKDIPGSEPIKARLDTLVS